MNDLSCSITHKHLPSRVILCCLMFLAAIAVLGSPSVAQDPGATPPAAAPASR